jgi:hypothetical protein
MSPVNKARVVRASISITHDASLREPASLVVGCITRKRTASHCHSVPRVQRRADSKPSVREPTSIARGASCPATEPAPPT